MELDSPKRNYSFFEKYERKQLGIQKTTRKEKLQRPQKKKLQSKRISPSESQKCFNAPRSIQ